MTIASLHQLGQYVKYYQQGALVKNIEIGVQYLCYFDLVDFRVVLRVQSTAANQAMIVQQLESMRRRVDEVASNFRKA